MKIIVFKENKSTYVCCCMYILSENITLNILKYSIGHHMKKNAGCDGYHTRDRNNVQVWYSAMLLHLSYELPHLPLTLLNCVNIGWWLIAISLSFFYLENLQKTH